MCVCVLMNVHGHVMQIDLQTMSIFPLDLSRQDRFSLEKHVISSNVVKLCDVHFGHCPQHP